MISARPVAAGSLTSAASAGSLSSLLRDECEAYRRLSAMLEQEQAALVGADAERAAVIAAEKSGLYGHLQDLTQRRNACLAAAGVPARGAVRIWAKRFPAEAEAVLGQWRELSKVVKETRRQNALNSRLANALMQHFRSRLALLSGHRGDSATTYGKDGATRVVKFPGVSLAKL